jgi:hypothetical protein
MTQTNKTLQPEQEQAIALILTGATDQAIADAVGVSRGTVNTWRNHNADFMAELNQRRAVIWEGHTERLRGLAAGAIDILQESLEGTGDLHSKRQTAVHILKACGLYGQSLQPSGKIDPVQIEKDQALDLIVNSW